MLKPNFRSLIFSKFRFVCLWNTTTISFRFFLNNFLYLCAIHNYNFAMLSWKVGELCTRTLKCKRNSLLCLYTQINWTIWKTKPMQLNAKWMKLKATDLLDYVFHKCYFVSTGKCPKIKGTTDLVPQICIDNPDRPLGDMQAGDYYQILKARFYKAVCTYNLLLKTKNN